MKVKDLHYLLSQALINTPEIAEMDIKINGELDNTMKVGVFRKEKTVLILEEESYLKSKGMEVYSYECV